MNQSELALGPEPGPDVFDMNMPPDASASAPAGAAHGPIHPAPTSSGKGIASRIGPMHVGILAFILAGAWILWPAGQPVQSHRTPAPSSRASVVHAVANTPATGRTPTASTDADIDPPPASASSSDRRILEEQAKQATALIETIDAVNRRLMTLEQHVANLPHTAIPALPAAMSNTVKRARAANRPSGKAPAVVFAPGTYQLNTIFRDQAWIAQGDTVHVVTAGDSLGDMTITKIDAARRVVVTDRGTIR